VQGHKMGEMTCGQGLPYFLIQTHNDRLLSCVVNGISINMFRKKDCSGCDISLHRAIGLCNKGHGPASSFFRALRRGSFWAAMPLFVCSFYPISKIWVVPC